MFGYHASRTQFQMISPCLKLYIARVMIYPEISPTIPTCIRIQAWIHRVLCENKYTSESSKSRAHRKSLTDNLGQCSKMLLLLGDLLLPFEQMMVHSMRRVITLAVGKICISIERLQKLRGFMVI